MSKLKQEIFSNLFRANSDLVGQRILSIHQAWDRASIVELEVTMNNTCNL